jgi:hypothetical protein
LICIEVKPSFVLACLMTAAPCVAQQLDAWLELMIGRLTVDLQGISSNCAYSMTEAAHWSATDQDMSVEPQRLELWFADPEHWRLHHAVGDHGRGTGSARVDYARSGVIAWDLMGGLLTTYGTKHGRLPSREDLNQPIRSRLASFGYCLTGGLHLVNILNLGDRELHRLPGDGWELKASGGIEQLTYRGSWDAQSGRGRVERMEITASRAAPRVGNYWIMSGWMACPVTGWDIASQVDCHDAQGKLSSKRTMRPITRVPPDEWNRILALPMPGEDVFMLGRAELREWRRLDDGKEEHFVMENGKWLRVAVEQDELKSNKLMLDLAGWALCCFVISHGLAQRRHLRRKPGQ